MQLDINALQKISQNIGNIPHLDCQGVTNYLHTIYSQSKITHEVYFGKVVHAPSQQVIQPHFWIQIEDFIVDYKLNIWLKIDNCPYGIFYKSDYPCIEYIGEVIELPVLSIRILEFMALPVEKLLNELNY